LVDLDGDGIPDIISGSWPGELYFFRGQGKGRFAAGQKLTDKDGKVIKVGNASTVFAVDWNGDGKLDLLIGCIEGDVYLVLNEGDGKTNAFGPAKKLEADGKPIKASQGDSHPLAADWDRDGKLDLIVGCGDGSVVWYRNVGTSTEPKLAAAQTLFAPAPIDWNKGMKQGQHGMRAKICVVDWNGDGWPDLLVGDFGIFDREPPQMTEADKAKKQQAEHKLQEFAMKLGPLGLELEKLQKAPAGETAEAAKQRQVRIAELEQQIAAITDDPALREARETVIKYLPQTYTGSVWLFLRQPPAAVSGKQ
jgi:hypothetical protein